MFTISTHDLRTINTYDAALRRWEAGHKWRKGDPKVRALSTGVRPNRNKTIVKHDDGRIAARLHSTDLVTYYPDGRVMLTRYDSQSSCAFITAVCPQGMYASMHQSATWFNCAGGWYQSKFENHSLTFRKTEGTVTHWTLADPENAAQRSVLHVDRRAAKAAREKFVPFTQWVTAVHALNGNDMTALLGDTPHAVPRHVLGDVHDEPTNVEMFPRLLRLLTSQRYKYVNDSMVVVRMLDWNWQAKLQRLVYKEFHCFTEKEIPLGELPPVDRWRK